MVKSNDDDSDADDDKLGGSTRLQRLILCVSSRYKSHRGSDSGSVVRLSQEIVVQSFHAVQPYIKPSLAQFTTRQALDSSLAVNTTPDFGRPLLHRRRFDTQ